MAGPEDSPTLIVQLRCGVESLVRKTALGLERYGIHCETDPTQTKALGILLDEQNGFAIQLSEKLNLSSFVIVTDNPCPEYLEDLWSFGPRALVAGGYGLGELARYVQRAAKGERFRKVPGGGTPLTRREREILRSCAWARPNKRIANDLEITERTVQNTLSNIFEKLDLENRTEAALYYWGLWHLLGRAHHNTQGV